MQFDFVYHTNQCISALSVFSHLVVP
uniref:Uncharacterized protein n=1 Tax=Rhizophora mucronata TaxID=61149 RepID=A0A2P2PX22_RHIMU